MNRRPAASSRSATAARVPQSRLGRLGAVALAAGELALGGNARRLAERLARLRGGAMKLGQMMSMQGEHLLPPEFAQALAILRSEAAPMPLSQLRRVLGREYGKGWEARFEWFDYEPIAAASIGQVHRARTRDGRELALKIQYPGVARSIRSDVDNVAAVLRLARVLPAGTDIDAIAAEAARQLGQEADYLAEAESLARYARLVADEPRLVVPCTHRDLTTTRILAMDFVEGEPLEALAASDVSQATRDSIGTLLERLVFRELFEFRTMQTDPNFANYLWQPASERVALLDFGATTRLDPELVECYARITRAVIDQDRDAIAAEAIAIGYVGADDSPTMLAAAIDIIELVCEPLRHRGPYDFPASDLPLRARALGLDLGMRKRLLRAPPPQTMFLHRKLVGSYLMLAHIGARVDVRALVLPFVAEAAGSRRRSPR